MPNLTLKDVPERLHTQLRARADRHHRSLNREAIACLEAAVLAEPIDVEALIAEARSARRRARRSVRGTTIRGLVQAGRA